MKKMFIIFFLLAAINCKSQWVQLETNNSAPLVSISAVNDNIIWTTCYAECVIKSTNGGMNWIIYNPGLSSSFHIANIYAVNESKAFISGSTYAGAGFCFMTTNGGTNWFQVLNLYSGFINAVWFKNSNEGILTGDPTNNNWKIYKTTNGGFNWDLSASFASLSSETGIANSLACYGDNVWIGTSLGRVLRSTNFGNNWSIVNLGTSQEVSSFNFINAQTGMCSGMSLLKYTTNAGVNWNTLNYPSTTEGVGIAGNMNEFIIGVLGRTIYKTTNGGTNWSAEFALDAGISRQQMTKSRDGVYVWDARSNGKVGKRTIPIGIQKLSSEIPSGYNLSQNYPNPFNPATIIRFNVPETGKSKMGNGVIVLKVYDVIGREVVTLVNEKLNSGTYEATFDASKCTSGVYFYRLTADGFSETRKMVLLK